ncbi:hypothetical protein G9A89_004016 [Geosiphon pyriformis]|nr:hypothetical protein G9A89_004016 [Geosiphon pyriformis]
MDLKTAFSSNISKKKVLKGTLHNPTDNKKNISLVKLNSGSMYSDMDSKSSCNKDNIVMESVNSGSLLGSAATTSKVKKVISSMIFGSLFGSPNYEIKDEVKLFPSLLGISLDKK